MLSRWLEFRAAGKDVLLASGNAVKSPKLAQRFGIDRLPAVVMVHNGVTKPYEGVITAVALLAWLEQHTAPAVVSIETVEALKGLLDVRDTSRPSIVGIFEGASSEGSDKFHRAADALRSEYCFVKVTPHLAQLAGLDYPGSTTVVVHPSPHSDGRPDVRSLSHSTADAGAFRQFLRSNRLASIVHLESATEGWLLETQPMLIVMIPDASIELDTPVNRCQAAGYHSLAALGGSGDGFIPPAESSPPMTSPASRHSSSRSGRWGASGSSSSVMGAWRSRRRYRRRLSRLATSLLPTQLQIIVADRAEFAQRFPNAGLPRQEADEARVLIASCGIFRLNASYSDPGCPKYLLDTPLDAVAAGSAPSDVEGDALIGFVSAFQAGQLVPHMRSAPPPKARAAAGTTSALLTVRGSTFEAEVTARRDLDVLLLLHAGPCTLDPPIKYGPRGAKPRCQVLYRTVEQVAKEITSLGMQDRLLVAAVDLSTNEIPNDFDIGRELPPLLFFLPADRSGDAAARLVEGPHTFLGLLQFLRASVQHPEALEDAWP